MATLRVASFYKFVGIENSKRFRDYLSYVLSKCAAKGCVYVAPDGFNGQIVLPEDQLVVAEESLGTKLNIDTEEMGVDKSFGKLQVLQRPLLGQGREIDTSERAHVELSPDEWHEKLSRRAGVVIDCRNYY